MWSIKKLRKSNLWKNRFYHTKGSSMKWLQKPSKWIPSCSKTKRLQSNSSHFSKSFKKIKLLMRRTGNKSWRPAGRKPSKSMNKKWSNKEKLMSKKLLKWKKTSRICHQNLWVKKYKRIDFKEEMSHRSKIEQAMFRKSFKNLRICYKKKTMRLNWLKKVN